jgi:hypothetical protein
MSYRSVACQAITDVMPSTPADAVLVKLGKAALAGSKPQVEKFSTID